jgi:hypothetical protein
VLVVLLTTYKTYTKNHQNDRPPLLASYSHPHQTTTHFTQAFWWVFLSEELAAWWVVSSEEQASWWVALLEEEQASWWVALSEEKQADSWVSSWEQEQQGSWWAVLLYVSSGSSSMDWGLRTTVR